MFELSILIGVGIAIILILPFTLIMTLLAIAQLFWGGN